MEDVVLTHKSTIVFAAIKAGGDLTKPEMGMGGIS